MSVLAAVAAVLVAAAPAAQPVSPAAALIGGDPFPIGTNRCAIGFNAHTAAGAHLVVTSGHCTGSTSPAVVVAAPAGSTSTPLVRGPGGTTITVRGSTPAPIGATVCKYGPTTRWSCGTVLALNQTVTFPGGVVRGLTRTNLCAEPGDTGGPVVTPDGQAQGVVVGGSGNCSTGGTTFFQPIRPVLSTHGIALHTG